MRFVVSLINEYDPGPFPEDFDRRVIQLASNENPYPPHQEVISTLKNSVMEINRYPSPYYRKLKNLISEYLGVDSSNIAVSNGASDLLRLVTDLFIEPFDRVFIPMPSYTLYALFSMLREAQVVTKVFEGYRLDGCYDRGKLAFLCSPNNPTGNVIDRAVIEEFLENFDYVVVDEAYSEFAGTSVVDLINHYENLIVIRSFSKFFGLAGMRVGYAIAHENVARAIEKIRNPFSISTLAYKAAIAALENVDYYRKIAGLIVMERDRIAKRLGKMFYVYESHANFLLVRHEVGNLADRLMERGILVRDVTGLEGLEGPHFRVSVGRKHENDAFLSAVEEIT
ncbi:histidinol-phosphate transaminase [Geoglobus acetivorans]|uniref:Histidinol-phosphate aminotransferase n=1 Tax=Geoglobus acetivorans TaxID=565033 RepID=A0ABZ3H0H7_GEOAI|nr:histidinol-phosphate transaminase [Geoglobus acetivorans]